MDATNIIITATNHTHVVWLWGTNYWLNMSAGPHGHTSLSNSWQASGSNVSITAIADSYCHFTNWAGDLPPALQYNNPLTITMNGSRFLTALFDESRTSQLTPHAWLAQYGWTNNFEAAAALDADGDHTPTWQEYVADTNPTNIDSCLRLQEIAATAGGLFRWAGGTGVVQFLERGSALTNAVWTAIHTNLPPTPVSNAAALPLGANGGLFRIRASR